MSLNKIKRFDCHTHSMYSNFRLIDSITRPKDLIQTAYNLGLSGVALTDHETVAGHVDFLNSEKELKEKGLIANDFKCACGNEIYLVDDRNNIEKYWHYILIAKNTEGHRALRELSSIAWYNGYMSRGMMRVPTEKKELETIVKKYPNSLIASTACFRKGTQVLTMHGEKNIEDITNEDYILNRYGEWEKVNFPTQRVYHGEGREILFLENPKPTICTLNHQFLITTNNKIAQYRTSGKDPLEWVEAKDLNLSKGNSKHICLFPLPKINYSNNNIIHRYEWKHCLRKDNYLVKKPIKTEIQIIPEVMRLFGLWLGDGSTSINPERNYYMVGFTFHEDEFDIYWKSFVEKASQEIGIEWSINRRPKYHRVDLYSHSIELVELFYYLFKNKKGYEKFIPNRIKHISKELDFNLFFGYALADGYFRKRENKNYIQGEFCSASVSERLTKDFQDLLKSLSIRSSITVAKERTDKNGTFHQKSYYLSSSNKAWAFVSKKEENSTEDILNYMNIAINHDSKKFIEINGIYYKKVYFKSIKTIELNEVVHCLNVNSHSFVCNNTIVHNCLGGQIDELVLQLIKAEEKHDETEIFNWKSKINNFIQWNVNLFKDDFYLEIQAGKSKEQIAFNKRIYNIAEKYNIKIVVSSDSHYLTEKERPVHKAYLNSKDGEREVDAFYESTHLMDNEEVLKNLTMAEYTEEQFKKICDNTMEIYNKIENYNIFHKPIIPEVQVKDYPKINKQIDNCPILTKLFASDNIQERAWVNMCWNSLVEKKLDKNDYIERLEKEADIISFLSEKIEDCLYKYFNTFQHYIELFWKCGSMVGPGRGSSGAFLSNYLLGITQADPIKFNFPEWRFLNKEKIELPDIDIDLTPSCRQSIFNAIREERGELNLVQVCTYGTEGTRSAIAAGGRGYRSQKCPNGLSVEETQYLSSLVPVERGVLRSIHDCVYGNEEKNWKPISQLVNELNKYPGLLEIIESIEGLVCKRGIHASGVMMYNNSPFDTNALMRSPNGDLTTQYALHESEQLGE